MYQCKLTTHVKNEPFGKTFIIIKKNLCFWKCQYWLLQIATDLKNILHLQ